jgi:hypothetical protein
VEEPGRSARRRVPVAGPAETSAGDGAFELEGWLEEFGGEVLGDVEDGVGDGFVAAAGEFVGGALVEDVAEGGGSEEGAVGAGEG